ncbi:hypothetical protein [Pyrococcus sp. ST04]|uniref:hypothetical protein n=1 Tax=Pyrococcus sp. ST04 TaxID=1183377 RepID=UPI000A9CA785|nr:hypothetical protein [Pyrococcus sp. ST04]
MNGTELKQISFECSDLYFDFRDYAYRATLSCRVYLYNPASIKAKVKDIAVLEYSLGELEDVPAGSLGTGKWSINPSSFTLSPQETKIITFNLPLEISSQIPISGADATEVVLQYGRYVSVEFNYTLGYAYDEDTWIHFSGSVYGNVLVKMDTKTIAADYMLTVAMAYLSAWTLIKAPGKVKIGKVEFNPAGILIGVILYKVKEYILELT